jgi:hypothetical protein
MRLAAGMCEAVEDVGAGLQEVLLPASVLDPLTLEEFERRGIGLFEEFLHGCAVRHRQRCAIEPLDGQVLFTLGRDHQNLPGPQIGKLPAALPKTGDALFPQKGTESAGRDASALRRLLLVLEHAECAEGLLKLISKDPGSYLAAAL